MLLDEAANTPLPKLPQWASTVTGAGVQLGTEWQSKAQIDQIYGRDADDVLTNHRTKLVYPSGLSDLATIESVSALVGKEHVRSDLDEHLEPGRRASTGADSGDRGSVRVRQFKSTARWDLREGQPSEAMEDAIVKTIAAFLNTDGGTLLIGIGPDGALVGLGQDYARVKPKNGDGFVNWLTTHLITALGHTPVTRTRARIAVHAGHEICRVDVAASPTPVWAKTSKDEQVFFVRMNNSTRALPVAEVEAYRAEHWPRASR